MIVRNHTGAEGLVAWRKIQAHQGAPVRLTYGYATTVDTAQGSTATEHIHAMPAGSQAIHGFKAYTAASRHERTTWIVVDEASERRQLASRSMLGQIPDIREADVWRNIGENLSRQPQKASALDMLHANGRNTARDTAARSTAARLTMLTRPKSPACFIRARKRKAVLAKLESSCLHPSVATAAAGPGAAAWAREGR